ncbi:1-deoxy-D-xylulose-5-phosphate reductoisomerase [Psychrobium sp. 1_MG-2023]|uniref:1-deoxy-D-xylulose-5-phosphate reductoisomerase n=1 Tax=Psychrobium sp. 1_MG-2023 TaxID=3062624 RepID=UPI000C335660|nr:1-deoxy-D-xylulose-5-phosphate reductoisomerase [Psychrobium sp. 1_MG-2023]MDP2559990.1 1-deoxy-D-xylulose-5-phosphate reductoisomerase [Psychrobium sp. 1_MG-2023]PKF56348.1 1-deoxy-D-xylulose-5-phosphate reductoisomerase [Alteromonadales bacterium alter-6D02]
MKQQMLTILGATGSIGTSTLDVIRLNPKRYGVFALAAQQSAAKMQVLCEEFNPQYAVLVDETAAEQLRKQLPSSCSTKVLSGVDALCEVSADEHVDTVMAAIVGAAGLLPTLSAIRANKRVLLANKEALVMTGQLFIEELRNSTATLLPVDSEHNAIFQALPTLAQQQLGYCPLNELGVSKLLLTGSGGPFLQTDLAQLKHMTPQQACAHPNWSMGQKISVDSATMMNKGLEYIEARWLFDTQKDQIEVVVHPQSVIHSMVQYIDGSVIAQMGLPDMRTPIAYSMAYPERIDSGVKALDFFATKDFTFVEPDFERFPCLKLAIDACYQGQSATTALNAANEISVAAFLAKRIGFTDIASVNQLVLDRLASESAKCIDSVLDIDRRARAVAQQLLTQGTR